MEAFVGHMAGAKIVNCHASGRIEVRGKPKGIDVGGFAGRVSGDASIEDISADTEIEYGQD